MLRLKSGNWNSALIGHLFNAKETKAIMSLLVGSFNHAYVLFWHFTKDGEYTVKSGYKVAFEYRGFIEPSKPSRMQHWWKILWGLKLLPKVKSFYWKLGKG